VAINDKQVKSYMSARRQGQTQSVSALKSGFSERSGRRLEQQNYCKHPKPHNWRTRKDPFEAVWELDLEPLLDASPGLSPSTLLEVLQDRYPEQYPDNLLRTLQRRVKKWKATHGPDKEVMFRQNHKPGQLCLSDFTVLKGVEITISGNSFQHLLYHFRLAYGQWSYMRIVEGGESFTALAAGLQEALLRLGGVPLEHRTDSLSAAYRNLSQEAKNDLTARYQAFCEHYGLKPTRNNPGKSHENGAVESPHGHLKRRITQALLLRGHTDFESIEAYQVFIDEQVHKHNRRNQALFKEEQACLQPLPAHKACTYEELTVRVTSSSTIHVKRVVYSVPSSLIGMQLRIRLYDSKLLGYLGRQRVWESTRVYAPKGQRARCIDYRHLIHSLIRKPMAFYHAELRDDILPDDTWRLLWQHINQKMAPRPACYLIVHGLKIAAELDNPSAVVAALRHLLATHDEPSTSFQEL
jgi:transposase InsO family protein